MPGKITQIRVGKNLIGLRGLEEVFREVGQQSWESDEAAQDELFRRVAAQNYLPPTSRPQYRRALWREFCRLKGEEVPPETPVGLEIKVLGLGCAGCRHFYQQVVDILSAKKIEAGLQYITDPSLLKEYEVRAFPALILNDRMVLAGRIPQPAELTRILMEAHRKAEGGERQGN